MFRILKFTFTGVCRVSTNLCEWYTMIIIAVTNYHSLIAHLTQNSLQLMYDYRFLNFLHFRYYK